MFDNSRDEIGSRLPRLAVALSRAHRAGARQHLHLSPADDLPHSHRGWITAAKDVELRGPPPGKPTRARLKLPRHE